MAECELKVRGKGVAPMGNLSFNDDNGYVEWKFVPIAASGGVRGGKVKTEGQDSILLNGPGKFVGKPYGKVVNFSLYRFNKKITYTFKSGDNIMRCKSEDDFDMNF